ncbi:MAG TPA: exosortase/archaeosortase family protein [Verrucomicrobiota bacterium]|nr:exosortase/archaeosortase family protein [Verrucomicrobiota bacterium]
MTLSSPSAADIRGGRRRGPLLWFAGVAALLILCFCKPLFDLVRFAAGSNLFSHILLIPLVSAYLIFQKTRHARRAGAGFPIGDADRRGRRLAVFPAVIGAVLLAVYWGAARGRGPLPVNDYLCLTVAAFLSFLVSGALACLGSATLKAVAFPAGFLVFMVPLPDVALEALEVFFQHTSAVAAYLMFLVSGTPMLRDGLSFRLPGISLQVAQECSGIHSSLVLFITGLLAGQMFLSTGWKRWALALAVIPLGILRNGFRIFTIAMLCIHVDPGMIDSPLHRRGGPIFFGLSLVPLLLLLLWLHRTERTTDGRERKIDRG